MNTLKKLVPLWVTLVCASIVTTTIDASSLLTTDKNNVYYMLNGKNTIPLPTTGSSIIVDTNSHVETSFADDTFDPMATITHSMNPIKANAIAVSQDVIYAITDVSNAFSRYEMTYLTPYSRG